TEVHLRELRRDPDGVASLADRDDMRVLRRGGVPLLLVREDRAEQAADGALAAARALRAALRRLGGAAPEALSGEFPWADHLPADDRRRFAEDFGRAVQTSAEMARWDVLSRALAEWRATATAHSDAGLAAALTGPVEDTGPVPPPPGCAKAPGGWELRFGTSEAVTGWEELQRAGAAWPARAWAALRRHPARPRDPARQHRLRGLLAEREIDGRRLPQWQYEVAGGGRVWYCPDGERRVVRLVAVAPVRAARRG